MGDPNNALWQALNILIAAMKHLTGMMPSGAPIAADALRQAEMHVNNWATGAGVLNPVDAPPEPAPEEPTNA